MKLTTKGRPASKTAVHQYMTMCRRLKPLKLHNKTKVTEAQICKRLALDAQTLGDSAMATCVVFGCVAIRTVQAPNCQNDVYAHTSNRDGKTATQHNGLGMMSYHRLSELHIIPRGHGL